MSLIDRHSLRLHAAPRFIHAGFSAADPAPTAQADISADGGADVSAADASDAVAPYSVIYAFGDSLSDAGNIFALSGDTVPVPSIYSDGRFTNGPVWVQDLATTLDLPAVTPSLSGGTDFAYGDAESGTTPLHSSDLIDLPSQLTQFESEDPTPQANALYTLSIGSNDVFDAIGAFSQNPALAMTDIADAVANIGTFITGLAADGAQNFLVMNVPDLGKTPTENGSLASSGLASALASLFNNELNTELGQLSQADHLNLHVLDAYSLLDEAVADPQSFGLTNVTSPVWTGNYTSASSGTLEATGTAQAGYLFWDHLHPTATGHAALAAAALNALGVTS